MLGLLLPTPVGVNQHGKCRKTETKICSPRPWG